MAIGLVLMGFAAMNYLGGGSDASAAPGGTTTGTTYGAPGDIPADTSLADPSSSSPGQLPGAQPTTGRSVPSDGRGAFGLLGTGSSRLAGKHSITLQVTSPGPIDFVNYYVPTAKKQGVVYNVGTSWSVSGTVFGPPDYAQIFLQANGAGDPITCTITVDGTVTEKRTTQDPYGQIFCQG